MNAKIRVAKVREYKRDEVLRAYDQLAELALAVRIEDTVRLMKQVVPEIKSNNSRFEKLDKINNKQNWIVKIQFCLSLILSYIIYQIVYPCSPFSQ